MRELELVNNYSLHKILISEDVGYLTNGALVCKLESLNLDEFPEYKDLIVGKMKRDRRKSRNLTRAEENLKFLITVRGVVEKHPIRRLPSEFVTKIISHLTTLEQENLSLCGEGVKKLIFRKKMRNDK